MVGLVLVSHSRAIAEGTAELVRHMAGEVEVVAVGGDSEGGLARTRTAFWPPSRGWGRMRS